MQKFIYFLITIATLAYAEVGDAVALTDRYKDSTQCKACHNQIIKHWQYSWHSKSHYEKDEYFQKSIDYLSRKSRKSKNAIKVECAGCHNPRILVTETNIDYEILVAMKLDKNSKVNKALESDSLSEGINCVVCHNIDKIHTNLSPDKRGVHRVSWMPQGTMVGPFANAFSPYHKTEQREHFTNKANTLCLVCHANDRSESGLVFSNMESEYKENSKQCVDCHMGPKEDGIASTLRLKGGKQVPRKVRKHTFIGAHSASLWEGSMKLRASKAGTSLIVNIENPNPHNIPSGFGGRELIVDVEYKSNGSVLKRHSMSLTRTYVSKRGKPTVPHLAVKQSDDTSIPAQGSKNLKFPFLKEADSAVITLSYRLVNDEIHSLLELKDPIWSKKMLINTLRIKF